MSKLNWKLENREERLIELYNSRMKYTDIAKEIGISLDRVKGKISALKRKKVIKSFRKINKFTEKDRNKLKKLKYQGLNDEEIAKIMGVKPHKIKNERQVMGLQEKRIAPNWNKKIKNEKINPDDFSYKPPKLKVGQAYQIKGKLVGGVSKGQGTIQGKVIAEYPHYYIIQTGNYKECVNKMNMRSLEIKEV